MAERQTVYPMLPVNHWWTLREKFKQSIPGTVTASYLATVLNMKEISARSNILPFIQQLGITDDEGKTLDRAREWRDDTMYPDVCATMAKEVYPSELLEAVPDPANNRAAAERWFSHKTGAGDGAVKRMAVFFSVLMMQIRKTGRELNPREEKTHHQPVIPRKRRPALQPKPSRNRARNSKVATMRPVCTLTCRYTFRQTLRQIRSTRYSRVWRHTYIEKVDIGDGTDGANGPASRKTFAGRSAC